MKKIYLLLIAFTISSLGFGQISEGFETGMPTSYTSGNISLTSGTWVGTNIIRGTTGVQNGSYSCQMQNATGSQITTPTLTGGVGTISFYVSASTSGTYQVNISTDNGVNFTPATGSPFTIATTTPTLRSIIVNNPAVNRIQIYRTGSTLYVDSFATTASGCTQPSNQASNFSATGITSTTANVNWTRPVSGGGDNVLVVMRQGAAVTTNPSSGNAYPANAAYGTPSAQLGATGNYVVYNGPLATVNVTNLVAGLTYHVAVYEYNNTSLCYKTPALLGNFSTTCPVFSLPFTEGFEAATFPPSCWTSYRGTNGLGIIEDWKRSTTSRTGTGAAYVQFENITPNAIAEDWLVTPAINLAATVNNTLTFWTRDTYTSNFNTVYTVRVSTTSQTNRASFTTIQTYTEIELGNAYNQKSIVLPAIYNTGTVYIAFVMAQDDGDDWLIDDVSLTGSAPGNSANSNIVDNGFDPTDDFNYISYSAASGLTTANAIKIGEFRIQDGGNTPPDADALATTLTNIGFTVQSFGDIRTMAIFDGTTNLSEATNVTATTTFSSLNLVAPDNGSKVFSVYATFKSVVTDNNQIRLTVASATANPAGSTFAAGNAGGAQTSIAGNDNRIEVTATALNFVQQPTNTIVNTVMAPSPTVRAVDVNANLDLDYVTSVALSAAGVTFAGAATTSVTPVAGIATYSNLLFSAPGTGTLATVSGLANAISTPFNVTTVGWQIGVENQVYTIDFDNTVANVNNGAYAGTGFAPATATSGRLDSNAWATTNMSDGDRTFGATATTGDFARGLSTGGLTTGGFYAFNVGGGNRTFGFQPTGSDFVPGTVTLKIQNQTGQTVTSIRFQYTIYVRNDEDRSSSFNFSYSKDDINYFGAAPLNYTSPEAATGNEWIAVPKNYTLTGINVPDGTYVYARFTSDDVAGSGSRDEFGLDDIQVVFNPVPASNNSNIVSTGFNPTDNINYSTYSALNNLTPGNAIKVGEFSIQDGGNSLTDTDNLTTKLIDLSLNVLNSDNIAALAIFDGATNVSEVTSVTLTNTFNGLNLTANDNSNKVFSVYATFKSTVTDNEQIQLTISSAISSLLGSGFADADAGGAFTSITGDDNRIEVTATALSFIQQPTNVEIGQPMTPAVTVSAVDANNNLDVDHPANVSIISSGGSLSGSPVSVAPSSGVATFSSLVHTTPGGGLELTASSGMLAIAISDMFDVTVPVEVIATQDFDGTTPEWTYSVDVPFFDNGYGSDGFFGIIDINSASPINQSNMSNNILGENDLDDEGNGTSSFATVTFATIDVTGYSNLALTFDWDVVGYNAATDDALYELFYDGVGQGDVYLVDGGNDPQNGEGTVMVSILGSVTTVSLEVRIRDNGAGGYSGFDNFKLVGTPPTPVDYVYNNGWTPGDPSGVSTRFDNIQIIAGTTSLSAPTVANNLTIGGGTSLNINPTASLKASGTVTNDGTLTLNSTSSIYSSLITNSISGSGINNYNRHINGQPGIGVGTGANDLISPPVTGPSQTFASFVTANPNLRSDPNNVDRKLFGPFSKSTGTYELWINTVPEQANNTLDAGVGYRTASTDNSDFTFTGAVNTGEVTNNIVNTGPQFAIYNLIGNPYTSYLNVREFLEYDVDPSPTTVRNIDLMFTNNAAIYGYDGDASGTAGDGWVIYNLTTPTTVNIAPGQGFLVTADAASVAAYDMTFTPSMRRIGDTEDFIFGRRAFENNAHVKLQANIGTANFSTHLYFNDNSSSGMDFGYDAGVFGSNAAAKAIYSHLVQDNTGADLAIQALAYEDLGSVDIIVPLGINVPQGQQVTVSISESDLPSNIDLYLEDNVAGTFTLLNTNDYVFTPSVTLNDTGRFFLRFTSSTLSNPEANSNGLQIYTTTTPRALFIKGQLQASTTVSMYDIQGRMVLSSVLNTVSNSNQVDVSSLSSGVYVVKLSNSAQHKTQKVIIK